mgnify:CR=1 FL=1
MTETYTNANVSLSTKIALAGKQALLWVTYEPAIVSGEKMTFITIKGLENPLPFNRLLTDSYGVGRLTKWLEKCGWEKAGAFRR